MKVAVYFLGKPRDAHLNALAAEYVKRTRRYGRVEMQEVRPNRDCPAARHPGSVVIALQPHGRAVTSPEFREMVQQAELAAQDLVFLVGGADGFPPGWDLTGATFLSLTPLTLPHELARVLLLEQIYRAFAALRGHPYAH